MPRNFLLYIFCVVVLGLGITWRISVDKPQKIPRNGEVALVATVKMQPRLSERSQIIEIGDARLFVSLYPKYGIGDKLRVDGFVDSQGRIFNAKVDRLSPRLQNGKGNLSLKFKIWLASLRIKISTNISQFLPSREAALVGGMILGIDSISRDFRDQLIKTGTIHVVVVSGQNLSIVAGLFLALSKFIGRRQSLTLATLAVFAYALLTGFEPPVVRASLMVLFSSIAIYLGRERIAIWSLILAALIILFFSPQALFEISFQLTFAATLGIITLGQKFSKLFSGLPKKISHLGILSDLSNLLIQNAAIAVSAYIFTAPIIIFYFERISPIAPVVNILVAELVSPIMILGFLIAGASLIFMPLAQILAYLAYVPATIFVAIVEFFSKVTI